MEKLWRVLVPLILVVALGLGVFAYMDYRKQRACDRWREDYRVAVENVQESFRNEQFRETISDELVADFKRVGALDDARPGGCPSPEVEPPEPIQ